MPRRDHGIYGGEFAERIAGSAGLRNILVHEYNDVDHKIVHGSIRKALEEFASYVEAVQRFFDGMESTAGDAAPEQGSSTS